MIEKVGEFILSNNLYNEDSIQKLDPLNLDIENPIFPEPHEKVMKNRSRYFEYGWFVGSYGIRYVREIDYENDTYEGKKIKKDNRRRAWFSCPWCGKNFPTRVDQVIGGGTKSCGCWKHVTSSRNAYTMIEKREIKFEDITGQKFGNLTVKYRTQEKNPDGSYYWYCECDCGGSRLAISKDLKSGHVQYCPKCRYYKKAMKHLNKKYGKLLITNIFIDKDYERAGNGGLLCSVECECGRTKNKIMPLSFITRKNGQRSCGLCNSSHGEEKVKNVLEKMNIEFIQQQTFENCRNPDTNLKLKFDFYLPNLNYVIEYNGQQHYNIIDFFGGEEGFKSLQFRDNIKKEYCKNKNINFLEIPYTDFDIIDETYLSERIYNEKR